MCEQQWSTAWQQVTCKNCNKHYQCTPSSDYYNSTCATDGLCETCLLYAHNLHNVPMIVKEVDNV